MGVTGTVTEPAVLLCTPARSPARPCDEEPQLCVSEQRRAHVDNAAPDGAEAPARRLGRLFFRC